ncbi:MAG: hypothetical protein WD557_16440 [Dehalococcoidia bacterium]
MHSLSDELIAHQRGSQRRPVVQVRGLARRFGVRVLRWERYYTGAEPGSPHAVAIADDGSLVRARNDAGTLYVQRVASPGPGSTYSSWANLASVTSGTGVAMASRAGELLLAYVDSAGLTLRVCSSTDDGATWSAATAVVTEASAIGSVAVAFRANGDACLFYTLGTGTTLKRLRRTGGTWAGSGTNWTRSGDVASITGLAACHDGGDFSLVVTGTTVTTLHPRAWGARMGDGLLPANAWSALTPIAEADAASTTTFSAPAIMAHEGDIHATFVQRETGDVAADRVMYTHPAHLTDVNAPWSEPAPQEASGTEGLALGVGDGAAWAATPSGVWRAPAPDPDLLSERLVSCAVDVRPAAASCRVTLDNADGALTGVPNEAFPATMAGGTIEVSAGYLGGEDGEAEFGAPQRFVIDRVRHSALRGKRVVVIEASGAWEHASRWHATQAWQTAAGVLARSQVFAHIAARAGIGHANGGRPPSSDWSSGAPSFALLPGESASAAIARLLAVVSDGVRPDSDSFLLTGCADDDPSDYAYAPGEHPIASFTPADEGPRANWVRVQGPDRYAEAFDAASVAAHGPRLAQVRNLDATTDAKATAMAAGALRRAQWSTPMGRLVAPCNVGQQLFDVVTVTSETHGIDARDFRVIGCAWEYERGSGTPRFDSNLELGGL